MSTREQLIKALLGMLTLADELKNIAKAYKLAGVSRSHFYDIEKAYESFGRESVAPRVRRRPRMLNQTPPEVETYILQMTERYATYSYVRLADQLMLVMERGPGRFWRRGRCVRRAKSALPSGGGDAAEEGTLPLLSLSIY